MKILFITANRIGDAILSTGLLRHLTAQYPEARLTIACGPLAVELFRAVPGLERIIPLRKQSYNRHWLGLWRQCISTRWDLVVDLRNSAVSRLLLAKARAYRPTRRVGQHAVEDNASALQLSPPPAPKIWLDDQARQAAEQLIGGTENLIAFGPTANWPPKQWPMENFIALGKRLTAADGPMPQARILAAAAPHEAEQLQPLLQAFPSGQIIPVITPDLLTVAAALSKAKLFIGNDSGLMHLAAAMAIPTLGLFGPGYEQIYGPNGAHGKVVRTPESTADLLARLPHPGAHAPNLMASLSVDRAYQAAIELIGQKSRG
jgi:lipopolysaccharide export system permease protein